MSSLVCCLLGVHHGEIEVEMMGAAVGMSVELVVPSSRKAVVGVEMAVHDGERRAATDGLDCLGTW